MDKEAKPEKKGHLAKRLAITTLALGALAFLGTDVIFRRHGHRMQQFVQLKDVDASADQWIRLN